MGSEKRRLPATGHETIDDTVFDFRAGLFYGDCQMKKASWFFWAFVGLVWLVIKRAFFGRFLEGPPRYSGYPSKLAR